MLTSMRFNVVIVFVLCLQYSPAGYAKSPEPLNQTMIHFIYSTFRHGRPAEYLNCQWDVKKEAKPRLFSTGHKKDLTLVIAVKTSLSTLAGDMEISSGFSSHSEYVREEFDDPRFGRVERMTVLADDPYHHYLVFEHDGFGTVTKVELGNTLRQVPCLGRDSARAQVEP